ncbi:MAG: serine/threonine protein kinase [Spirochaetia bacterium]|nr:serine/threonine protein kinase [Spirochaetia bacterium]
MAAATTLFESLDPNTFLEIVEEASGKKLTGICRPYTSYINRVFELQTEDGESLVAKFYRPGRWSESAIQEEHDFLLELNEAEIPVIAPLSLQNGKTIGSTGKILFALFPKKGGRTRDELTDGEWLEVGRLLGRTHQIGAGRAASSRVMWTPAEITKSQIDFILKGGFVPEGLVGSFEKSARRFVEKSSPLFENAALIRIHGDLHYANLICRPGVQGRAARGASDQPGEYFFLIDFDDMAMGPAVQDLWMLLPGHREDSAREIQLFIEGYETFRDFPHAELRLIEALRGMRYLHYCSWLARQAADGGFSEDHAEWGTESYWREFIPDLERQIERIDEGLN